MLSRRDLVLALLGARASSSALAADAGDGVSTLTFPRDFGAHPESRIEWWYVTGMLTAAARTWGFQITFFRAATGIVGADASAFRAGELVFAHAAVTDLQDRRLLHDQRLARSGFGIAAAAAADTARGAARLAPRARRGRRGPQPLSRPRRQRQRRLSLRPRARRQPAACCCRARAGSRARVPMPRTSVATTASRSCACAARSRCTAASPLRVAGRAWLDHEWSDALLAPEAVGWDWIGMNLDDGGALTAFRLRRRDGTTLWAGGSHRPAGGAVRDFAPSEVVFAAGRRWSSPASKAAYPVEWTVTTPIGVFSVAAMQDDQELDSRASTGSIYWEGLSSLRDAAGRTVGSGYLEMTGYAGRLRL